METIGKPSQGLYIRVSDFSEVKLMETNDSVPNRCTRKVSDFSEVKLMETRALFLGDGIENRLRLLRSQTNGNKHQPLGGRVSHPLSPTSPKSN